MSRTIRVLIIVLLLSMVLCPVYKACAVPGRACSVYSQLMEETEPLRWMSPEGPRPECQVPEPTGPNRAAVMTQARLGYADGQTGQSSDAIAMAEAATQNGRVAILVETGLYDAIADSLATYTADLAALGFSSVTVTVTGDAPYVQGVLQGLYNQQESLVGAVLIGNIPYIIYTISEDFVNDFFYMDMNGTWQDSNADGKYDIWNDPDGVEIWTCRMKTDNLALIGQEAELLNNYFERNHAIRNNILNNNFTALAYPDDDWEGMGPGDQTNLEKLYDAGNVTMINDPVATNIIDYRMYRMTGDYQFNHIRSHGWHYGHGFYNASGVYETVTSADYAAVDPKITFNSLFVCSGHAFNWPDSLGHITVFNPECNGLLSVGSTKTGGMLYDSFFYDRIVAGDCIGEAFKYWFNQVRTYSGADEWYWGMVLAGDASLVIADSPETAFDVVPYEGYTFAGTEGGPFVPDEKSYTLRNYGTSSLNWTASTDQTWLEIVPAAGTVPAGGTDHAYIYILDQAKLLAGGVYSAVVTFTDTTNSVVVHRDITLKIEPKQAFAYWALDESSGTIAYDGSANGFDGTLVGFSFDTSSTGGVYDTALGFDGDDDHVEVPPLELNSNTVTITTWIKRNGTQDAWAGLVFSRDAGTIAGLNFGDAYELRYHWQGSESTWGWNSGLVVPDATWTFAALVVEPEKATIYMNTGSSMLSATNTTSHSPEGFFGITYLGRDYEYRRFKGVLDDVRIYNYSMQASEVGIVAQGPSDDFTPPSPDPMTWQTQPYVTGATSVRMVATTANDPSGVQYMFVCIDGGGHDSPWQDSTEYEDTGLLPETTYTYVVKARDKCSNFNTTTPSIAKSATTDPAPQIYVNDITMSYRSKGKFYYGQATVWIKDEGGADVGGATVYGNWSGVINEPDSGVTGTNGKVMIESSGVKNGGTFIFTVTGVTKTGYVYNPNLNVETSDSITAP